MLGVPHAGPDGLIIWQLRPDGLSWLPPESQSPWLVWWKIFQAYLAWQIRRSMSSAWDWKQRQNRQLSKFKPSNAPPQVIEPMIEFIPSSLSFLGVWQVQQWCPHRSRESSTEKGRQWVLSKVEAKESPETLHHHLHVNCCQTLILFYANFRDLVTSERNLAVVVVRGLQNEPRHICAGDSIRRESQEDGTGLHRGERRENCVWRHIHSLFRGIHILRQTE